MDTIVHIGAGSGCELAALLAQNPRRLVLLEPGPHQAANSRRKTLDKPCAEVRQVAVAPTEGPCELCIYNHRAVNSLQEPTALFTLFPGLRELQRRPVDTVTIGQLIASLQLTKGQHNQLVIDAAGEETGIVQSLIASAQLDVFVKLTLRCSREALYASSETPDVILARIGQHGYEIEDCNKDAEPDWPVWTLKRNAAQIEHHRRTKQLQEQIETLKTQLEATTNHADQQTKLASQRAEQLEQR